MIKKCKLCGLEKDDTQFKKHPETRDKLTGNCKSCLNLQQRESRKANGNKHTKVYEKSYHGFLMRAYRNMKSRISGIQTDKAHLYKNLDIIDKDSFVEWSLLNDVFYDLFKVWKSNCYNRKLTPSVDRINTDIGYSLDNMRWITHSENSRLGAISQKRKKKVSL